MMCWVTESPHSFNGRVLPLSFRFHSSMMGGLGIGANLKHWSEEEQVEAASYIELYKAIRPVVLGGSLYRLSSLRAANHAAVQYVSQDGAEAVVFVFLHAQQLGAAVPRILLQGLGSECGLRGQWIRGCSRAVQRQESNACWLKR